MKRFIFLCLLVTQMQVFATSIDLKEALAESLAKRRQNTGGMFNLPSPMELAQSLQAASGVTGPTLKDLYLQESYQMNVLMGYLYNQQELFEKIINHLNKIATSVDEFRLESKDERMYQRRSEKIREKWLTEIEDSIKRFDAKMSDTSQKSHSIHSVTPSITSRIDPYKVVIQQRKIINGQPETVSRVRRIENVPFNSITSSQQLSTGEGNVFDEID